MLGKNLDFNKDLEAEEISPGFVVDLKQIAREKKDKKEKENNFSKRFVAFWQQRLAVLPRRRSPLARDCGEAGLPVFPANLSSPPSPSPSPERGANTERLPLSLLHPFLLTKRKGLGDRGILGEGQGETGGGDNLRRLAIFNFFQLLGYLVLKTAKTIYRLCYVIGWLAIFFVRFFWLLYLKIVGWGVNLVWDRGIGLAQATKIKIQKYIFCHFNSEYSRGRNPLYAKAAPRKYYKKVYFINIYKRFLAAFRNDKLKIQNSKLKLIINPESFFSAAKKAIKEPIKALENFDPKELKKFLPTPSFEAGRSALAFTAIIMVLILPFAAASFYKSLDLENIKGRVLGVSETAVNNIFAAGSSAKGLDFKNASADFSLASSNFLAAQNKLNEINDLIFSFASIMPSEKLKLVSESKKFLAAGEDASNLGNDFSLALNSLLTGIKNHGDISQVADEIKLNLQKADQDAEALGNEIEGINKNNLPPDYQDKFALLLDKTKMLDASLKEFVSLIDQIKTFWGEDMDKRYLLVFQNNAEMRGSGGFVGSFAIIDFAKGKIKNIEVPQGGTYDTTIGLRENIVSPAPLQLLGTHWRMWDANWWPDWPKSASKLAWFYEKSGGSTVDGVISFTPLVMEKILAAIGPIQMGDDYNGLEINADNFWSATQAITEEKVTGEKTPKKIIGDLMNKIIAELPSRLNKDVITKLLQTANEMAEQKQVMFYFSDAGVEKTAVDLGMGGEMKNNGSDYLMVANTNVGGGKSDRMIRESIQHEATVGNDGSIINTVKIFREHTGEKNQKYVGEQNVDWMRIYVPQGSELLEASGFKSPSSSLFKTLETGEDWQKDKDLSAEEATTQMGAGGTKIYQEGDYTVFGNWSMVKPGETGIIYLRYRLPFKITLSYPENTFLNQVKDKFGMLESSSTPYSLLVQKQPGSIGSKLTSTLKLPANMNIVWHYPADLKTSEKNWEADTDLSVDRYFGVLIK
jgi:hypothetical protein